MSSDPNLAKASHIILQARLVSNGKDYGVQTFSVQIRKDGSLDSGVTLAQSQCPGDVSSSVNMLQFYKFKAPVSSLLSRFIKIDS